MKRLIFFIVLAVFLMSLISAAEITLSEPPKGPFNIGDVVSIDAKITTLEDLKSSLNVYLICNGLQNTIFSKDVILSTGEQETIEPLFILTKERLGRTTGYCVVKFSLEGFEPEITEKFEVSNLIKVEILSDEKGFEPGESMLIEGEAIKENGEAVKSGFVSLEIKEGNSSILTKTDTVRNGFFSLNISLPNDLKAGKYIITIEVYEIDKYKERTNQGFGNYNLQVLQVPTSLEIVIENPEVEPGRNLRVKGVLHDQTGERIESSVNLIIENNKSKVIRQVEVKTDEFLEVPIMYNEPPAEWGISAVSNELTSEATFKIIKKEEVRFELINNTIIITNIGNVPYNKTLSIRIGNESLNLDVYLDIDGSQKYILKAPDGEYEIEVLGDGKNLFNGNTMLTGRAVEVKEVSGVMTLMKHPFVWIFILLILGFVLFMFFRKGYRRSFFGRIGFKKKKNRGKTETGLTKERLPFKGNLIFGAKNKAELSLSLKGDKQNVSVVCVKIKNLDNLDLRKGFGEVLNKVINTAEENKAFTYENQGNLFFIVSPLRTKTFKNEKIAVNIAGKILEVLQDYNKLAKQRADFGICLHYGQIIAKKEGSTLKFMSLGTLMTAAKKISGISDGQILLSKEMRNRVMSDVKTEKHDRGSVEVYTIKEIKRIKEEDKKFISNFLRRLEEDKKK